MRRNDGPVGPAENHPAEVFYLTRRERVRRFYLRAVSWWKFFAPAWAKFLLLGLGGLVLFVFVYAAYAKSGTRPGETALAKTVATFLFGGVMLLIYWLWRSVDEDA